MENDNKMKKKIPEKNRPFHSNYMECDKFTGNNECSLAYPYITYCDVNRNNLQCPENYDPSKKILESDRHNQLIVDYKLRIGIRMIEKIERMITVKAGYYEDVNEFVIDSIRHNIKKLEKS